MKVVPRGGGHSYIANGLGGENGTVVVDMSNMKAIKIDSAARTVEIQMGNRLGDVAFALNNAGLALPHGTCPYVGAGGHTGKFF
jgi:FAD/FMN-containing dehydrogenase